MSDYSDTHIETTLPKPWEEEVTFQDTLYDWMNRAPWLAISVALHLLAYFVLAAVPWSDISGDKDKTFVAEAEAPPEEIIEEPEEEPEEEPIEEPIEEPVLMDEEVVDIVEDEAAESDSDLLSDANFEADQFNNIIGIGGGAGGKFGGRGVGKRNTKARGGAGTQQALTDALEWLKNHQSPDGSWDCDGFTENCGKIGTDVCEDTGNAAHDVGITGLALLAFLGNGDTTTTGKYKDVVAKGVKYLKSEQDYDSGLIGEDSTRDFIYNHAIATLALCEVYYFSKSPLIKKNAQKAVNYIARARNQYGAWRYDVPPSGENDTSVTGWMLFALKSAKDAKLKIDEEAITDGLAFLDDQTTPRSGHVGYDAKGSSSSRTPSNEQFPREKGEAMTAVGLLCRIFLGQDPDETELEGQKIMQNGADLLLTKLPEWDEKGFGCDMYYWYYGTYAMFQMGGNHWKRWNAAMKDTLLKNQIQDGDAKGSWNPVGPWGYSGGRVYSTALMTLCLEVYFRYGNVLGAR